MQREVSNGRDPLLDLVSPKRFTSFSAASALLSRWAGPQDLAKNSELRLWEPDPVNGSDSLLKCRHFERIYSTLRLSYLSVLAATRISNHFLPPWGNFILEQGVQEGRRYLGWVRERWDTESAEALDFPGVPDVVRQVVSRYPLPRCINPVCGQVPPLHHFLCSIFSLHQPTLRKRLVLVLVLSGLTQ
jgi:hypothetical protein